MNLIVITFTIAIEICKSINGARILAIVAHPSFSHQVVFRPIFRELALRGHQVTLVTSDPMHDPTLVNITEIDVHFLYDVWNANLSSMIKKSDGHFLSTFREFMALIRETNNALLAHGPIQDIIRNNAETFDLFISEFFAPPVYAFQHRFNCPFVALYPFEALNIAHEVMGNPTHPILYSDPGSQHASQLNFFERLESLYIYFVYRYSYRFVFPPLDDELVLKHFGDGYPKTLELRNRVDLFLVNAFLPFHTARPLVPGMVYIGGGLHLSEPKPLPLDIQEYLDSAKEGVIYFSLGSNVKSKDLPLQIRIMIMQVFAELPYKVLWKFEAENLEGKPDNVRIMKWIPQQDVLRHPNIKAFIMQGGSQSTEEAIFAHVPLVVIPFYADQRLNAVKIVQNGLGVQLNYMTMTHNELRSALEEVINNKSYKETAAKVAKLAVDQPQTAVERAVWWTEYVLRNPDGLRYFRGPAPELASYQYFFIDIAVFFIIMVILCFILMRSAFYKLRHLTNKHIVKEQKTKNQ